MYRVRMAALVIAMGALTGCSSTGIAPSSEPTPAESVTIFLEQVKTTWTGTVPEDDVLIEYGEEACDELEDGESPEDVTILEGSDAQSEDAAANTESIVDAAALSLCPSAPSE